MADVSVRFGVSQHSLYKGIKQFGLPPAERAEARSQHEEMRRLKSELRRVTEERDILKKAAASPKGISLRRLAVSGRRPRSLFAPGNRLVAKTASIHALNAEQRKTIEAIFDKPTTVTLEWTRTDAVWIGQTRLVPWQARIDCQNGYSIVAAFRLSGKLRDIGAAAMRSFRSLSFPSWR